jgi:hypothetical protein
MVENRVGSIGEWKATPCGDGWIVYAASIHEIWMYVLL